MLDPDGTLVLAGAARRALPQHLFRVHLTEFLPVLAGEQCVLCLQDDRLRIQLLARAPRRTVDLTAPALDTGERVEHHLAPEILHGLESDLFFFELEIRQGSE